MAFTKICVFFFLMMTAFFSGSMGDQYMVGDSAGWNSQGTDYKSWSSTIKFYVGDVIFFNYNPQFHNVVQVTKDDYEACSSANALASYTSGSDSIEIFASGSFYYICSYPGMCESGQKVQIDVLSRNKNYPAPMTPPSANLTPPGVDPHPYYWGFDSAASTTLCFYHHLLLVIFASFVFLLLNVQ